MQRLRSNREAAQGLASPVTAASDGAAGDGPTSEPTEPSYSPVVTLPDLTPRRIIADGYGTVADLIAKAARHVAKRYGIRGIDVDVLVRLAQGWEYSAIARQLGLSESAVANKTTLLRYCTNVANRHELTRLVFEEAL